MDPRDKPEDDAMRPRMTTGARAFQATEMASRETIGRVYHGFKEF